MEQAARPEIIDVHCHCFAGPEQSELVLTGLAGLRRAGVSQLAVMGLGNTRLDEEQINRLIPEGFPNFGDPLYNEVDFLVQLTEQSEGLLFPMIDTRGLAGDLESQLRDYLARGFRGIKGLYLADGDNDLGIASYPEVFGVSPAQYREREWTIFAFAEANDLPVLYHMDVNRYGDVAPAILTDFPRLRINFPHFGISRKGLRKLLDKYPNVYTDIAFMKTHIQANPESYRDFITHYPDRICFGSDALLYQPKIVLDYIELVRSLTLPEEVENNLLSQNPGRFLWGDGAAKG